MTTRRAHLAAIGLTAAAPLVAASRPVAAGPPVEPARPARTRAETTLELTARRTEITLPDVPALGVTYIALLDLFDGSGEKVGQASTSSFVVEMTTEGPIVLGSIVLHLEKGQIHYQRTIRRYGEFPRESAGAILGGAGEYADATGQVDVTWPDDETVELAVHLS